MSTFNGIVAEFPDIRVDFFRPHPTLTPPLACFLSHIHSDHLAGLETLKSPMVYCSAATKEMLLRLEKYPSRIAYANGQLEARVRTYKHLKTRNQTRQVDLLKPLPMETPTDIELRPGHTIRVTLFDANHCPGAVMFLFEGHGKAALYTGDIRSEPWHVNALTRSPCLIEYTSGLKTLDKVYLDTSFTEDLHFQTKAEGLRELLQQVSRYPKDTIFYFRAWTFGYEEVWIALAKALNSKIHVDDYKLQMYKSLRVEHANGRYTHLSPEAPALVGFMCGNRDHPGCLTDDKNVRLHSCEKGDYCSVIKDTPVVWIEPIIAHLPDHHDIAEVGIGGGDDDLLPDANPTLVVPFQAIADLSKRLADDNTLPDEEKLKLQSFLKYALDAERNISLDLDISNFDQQDQAGIAKAIFQAITKLIQKDRGLSSVKETQPSDTLPRKITFPYSRHSSYQELCHLVGTLRPKDVWPCTVSPSDWLERGLSIEALFGEFCAGDVFVHDTRMAALYPTLPQKEKETHDSQSTEHSVDADDEQHRGPAPETATVEPPPLSQLIEKANSSQATTISCVDEEEEHEADPTINETIIDLTSSRSEEDGQKTPTNPRAQSPRKRNFEEFNELEQVSTPPNEDDICGLQPVEWYGLLSTTNNHSHIEQELGEG